MPRALILVDLQYDFCPGGALAVSHGDETIAIANRVMPQFDVVVATQDWHPANHASFSVNNPGTQVGQVIEQAGMAQVMWPTHCVQGTHGAELHDRLDRERITAVFRKGTDPAIDSYSGFFDNGHKKATGLGEWLHARDISEVVVLGLATDYCVKFTALDARGLGLDVTLIEDGCRGVNLQATDSASAVAEMRRAGVRITQSAALS